MELVWLYIFVFDKWPFYMQNIVVILYRVLFDAFLFIFLTEDFYCHYRSLFFWDFFFFIFWKLFSIKRIPSIWKKCQDHFVKLPKLSEEGAWLYKAIHSIEPRGRETAVLTRIQLEIYISRWKHFRSKNLL